MDPPNFTSVPHYAEILKNFKSFFQRGKFNSIFVVSELFRKEDFSL